MDGLENEGSRVVMRVATFIRGRDFETVDVPVV